MSKPAKKTLAELLLESGMITREQLEQAKKETRPGESIQSALLQNGALSEEDMASFISRQMEVPRIELQNQLIAPQVIELVSEDLARKHQLVPVLKIGKSLTCAMADVFNIMAIDEVGNAAGLTIEPAVATKTEIKKALDEHYNVKGGIKDVIKTLDEQKSVTPDDGVETLKGLSEEAPVVKFVNMTIMQAVREQASDIHIEPEEKELKIRYRIDGILHEQQSPPKHFQSAVISRVKILSSMDIAERRRPQDGRFQMKMDGREIDIRSSSVPTIFGENIVLRLLDTSMNLLSLEQIGLSDANLQKYKKLLESPNGIILVTGPTGSGKTTTLYASLGVLNSSEKNIITIEDPVEYRLGRLRQIQVNPDIDLSFASGLRSILRQDPDIIMVGEIRDFETAEIAIQAALTGHLVLSTLHTNNAAGAITRLMDMGIEPYLIASSMIAVVAQRLVRLKCKECDGDGCSLCRQKGYRGRKGIYELMVLNEELRRLISRKASLDEIQNLAGQFGMASLRDDGIQKVEMSLTTKEEVFRVTQEGSGL